MSVESYKDAGVFFAGWDLTGVTNNLTLNRSADILDASVFGVGTHVNAAGLWDWSASVAGFFDAPTGVDATVAKLGTLTDSQPLILYPKDVDVGLAYTFMATPESMELFGAIGELTPFSAEYRLAREQAAQTYYRPAQGYLGARHIARTVAGNGTGVETGVLTSGQYMVCCSQVTLFDTITSVSFVFESDDDAGFGAPATRATHSYTTVNEGQMTMIAGPITPNDFWRVRWTITGTSFTGLAAFGVAEY